MFKDLKIMKNNNIYSMKRGSRSLISSTLAMTVGSPSGLDAKWKQNPFMRFAVVLTLIFTIGSGNAWGADVKDVITASDLAATSTTYTIFSDVTKTSDAVYAGQSAKDGSGNIQLRSKNSNSGIVTTESGGNRVKSVKITVGSGSNTVDVYGNTSAYSAASDLFSSGTQGTKIGSVSATGTITVTGDYTYVGIRSNNGAVYISSIEITWETTAGCSGTALSTPSVTATPSSNKLVLSWPNVDNATKYQVSWNGGAYADATSPFTKNSLSNGTTYTWAVKAIGDGSTWCNSEAAEGSSIPGTYYTVTFMNNGETYATKSIRSGTNLILPDNPSTCDVSKEFVGWSTTNIGSTPTNTKPTMKSTFSTISSATTLYAVFAQKTANSYKLGDANDLIEGQKVLIVNSSVNEAMANTSASAGDYMDAVSVDISSNTISSPASKLIWTVELDGNKYKFKNTYYVYAYSTSYIYCDADDATYPDLWSITNAGSGKYYLSSDRMTSDKKLEDCNSTFKIYDAGTTNYYKMSFFVPAYTAYVTTCCSAPGTALSISGSDNVTSGNTSTYSIGGGNGGTVTWSITNGTGSATINSSGVLTAGSVGTVTVKAHQDATGGYCEQDAEKTVTIVSSTVNVTGVTVSPTSKAIVVGETFTITPTVSPSNATDKSVSWSSSASGKASVNSSGVVTGVAAGSATITCTTTDGSFTDDCDVDVYSVTVQVKDVDGNTLSGAGMPTASASGRTLTASANGNNYVFKQWEAVTAAGTSFASSTSASTTLNGTPTGNVTIKAVYYKPINVTWKVGDGDASGGTAQVAYNTKITSLPTSPDDDDLGDCADTFMGWSGTNLGSNTGNSAPSDLFTSTSDAGVQALTSDQIYYAVFATASGGDVEWVLTDIDDLTSSDIFVLAESASEYAMTNDNGTSAAPAGVAITVVSSKITSDVAANMQWNISGNGSDGYVFYPNGSSTTWLYCNTTDDTGSNNNLRVGDGDRKLFVLDASGELVTNDTYVDRYIRWYSGGSNFRSYVNKDYGDPVAPKCYKKTGGVTYSDYMTLCCTSPGSLSETFYESSDDEATVKWTFPVDGSSNKKQAGVYVHLYADNAGAVGDEITAKKADYHDDNSTVSHTFTGLTASTSYWFTIEGVGRTVGGVTYCGAEESTPIKFTTQPSCSSYSFHYGNDGSGGWITECFGSATDHVRTISDFTIPSTTHFYVGKQNAWDPSSPGNADKANSVVTAWSGLYFDASIGDGDRPMVGQATGAVGTLKIIDNSTWNNKKASFIPDGYGITYSGTGKAFTETATSNKYETDIQTLPTVGSTTYTMGIATATSGTYVTCGNSKAAENLNAMGVTSVENGLRKIWLYSTADSWIGGSAKMAIWDATNSHWGDNTSDHKFMTKVSDNLWYGYVPTSAEGIVLVRVNPSSSDPNWDWGKSYDILVDAVDNYYTITGTWSDSKAEYTVSSTHPQTGQSGKFRMWDNSTSKNWFVHWVPYFKLSYDKNGGTGTMSATYRDSESATTTLKAAANGFTAPDGYHFKGWATSDERADEGTVDYEPNDDVEISEDKTLYAVWEINSYTITYNKGTYGTGSAIANGEKTDGEDFTLSSSTYSRTGYTQEGWATSDGGDKAYNLGGTYTTDEDLDLYPYWEAITTAITLNKNGGGKDGLAYAQYDESTIVVEDATAPTGYHLDGYYTNDATPVKIIKADGTLAADNITGYVTGGNWSYTSTTLTLYAQWEVNSYTLAWNKNADDADDLTGDYTTGSTNYNTALTAPNTPTRTGWTFDSWNTATDGSGDDYTGYMPAATTTYYAQWTINQYKMKVGAPAEVTITASVNASAKGEGSETDVDYGTTVTLNYSSLTSGHYWGGWKVTKTSDGTAVDVSGSGDGATFTMPAYGITITAIIYGNLKAWCDPQVTVSDGFCLTSYYVSGEASTKNSVYTTSAAGNLLTINSTDLGGVDRVEFIYLDGSDNPVARTSSPFRMCKDGSTLDAYDNPDYGIAETGSSDTWTISSLSNTCALSYSIRYKPTDYNLMDNYKLKMVFKKGSEVRKTIIREMNGRSLPEEFVIAAKYNGQWYALPNTLKGTQGEQGAIVPVKITVNNPSGTPTQATYAPDIAIYKGRAKYATANPSSMALTSTGSNYLQTSSASGVYQMWLSSSGDADDVDWYFKSSNRSVYELAMDPVNSPSKKMAFYDATYMGYYGGGASTASYDIYLLPVENKYTDIPATVTEWGQSSVILAVNAASADHATAQIETGDATSNQTITPINETKAKAKNFKVTLGDIDLDVAEGNEGKLLYINWLDDGGEQLGRSCVTIPRIVAEDRTANKTNDTDKKVWNTEVHVLPGATLTIDGNTFVTGVINSTVSMKELHVYPGATVNVSTGKLSASTLRLRNGWTRAGTKDYNVARVYIASGAALTKTTASMDYDIYETSDGKHYYPLAVPFSTAVSGIDYADTYLAGFSTYGTHYVVKEYNGARRAQSGPDQANNWTVVADDATLSPGKGYIMTAVAVKGEAIIRVPLTFDNGWTADGEKASYGGSTKNVVAVSAYNGTAASAHERHKGWNMLGVPFMSCYGAGTDMYSGGDASLINGELVVNTDADQNMEYQSTTIPYVSVPSHDFAEYVQTDITETKLLPGWSFFVQVDEDGDLTFAVSNQRPNNDNPIYAPKRSAVDEVLRTGIILSDGEASDKTTILISDQYSGADYEIGADLEKMFGNGYTLATYSLSGSTRLAYNAMSKSDATAVIPIGYRAPAEGEYTFSLNPRYAEANFERVDLIDYQTGSLTNLMTSSYTFTTGRTQDDSRFALNVVMKPTITTDVENGANGENDANGVEKVIINDHMYIIRSGKMYDATGKCVKGGQK